MNASEAAALERFAAARVARLATASPDGRPHLVPLCFVVSEGDVWSVVDEKPKKSLRGLRRLRNIAANPKVSLLVDHWDEDWKRLWFVLLEGEARLVDEAVQWERAMRLLREKYAPYRTMALAAATHPMLRIEVSRIVGWQADAGETPVRGR